MSDVPEEPKKSAADVAYTVVKAAVSAVPVAGGPAAELLGLIFGPPLEKRREEWLERLAQAVEELQKKVADLTPEKLSQNEVFITTALRASEIAVRTHQEEKLSALQNAVVNSALPGAPSDALQQIFLNYVDQFTPWHILILSFFNGPERWLQERLIAVPNRSFSSRGNLLEHVIPDLRGNRAFYDQVVRDLHASGLMGTSELHTMLTATGPWQTITTPMGSAFLSFISSIPDPQTR